MLESLIMRGGAGLTIKGDLTADEDVTIDGTFDGTIEVRGHRMVIGSGSTVKAMVTAATVAVHGRLEGHIAADRVDIAPTAVVEASVVAGRLTVAEGAQFNGPVNTERARAAGSVARHRATK
jgi:cytoskeletal protein CcmA (bactofilin family)